jgi:TatA/E family protein of Tat protein translocase
MFDIGLQEMLVIGVLALLVFGPSKLPELGRMIGRAMRSGGRASSTGAPARGRRESRSPSVST